MNGKTDVNDDASRAVKNRFSAHAFMLTLDVISQNEGDFSKQKVFTSLLICISKGSFFLFTARWKVEQFLNRRTDG